MSWNQWYVFSAPDFESRGLQSIESDILQKPKRCSFAQKSFSHSPIAVIGLTFCWQWLETTSLQTLMTPFCTLSHEHITKPVWSANRQNALIITIGYVISFAFHQTITWTIIIKIKRTWASVSVYQWKQVQLLLMVTREPEDVDMKDPPSAASLSSTEWVAEE